MGSGADEVVGLRLEPGQGLAGSVVDPGEGTAIPDCRRDRASTSDRAEDRLRAPHDAGRPRLERGGEAIGALSVLDRRDGGSYGPGARPKARMFAELAVAAI